MILRITTIPLWILSLVYAGMQLNRLFTTKISWSWLLNHTIEIGSNQITLMVGFQIWPMVSPIPAPQPPAPPPASTPDSLDLSSTSRAASPPSLNSFGPALACLPSRAETVDTLVLDGDNAYSNHPRPFGPYWAQPIHITWLPYQLPLPFELPCPICTAPLEIGQYCVHQAQRVTVYRQDICLDSVTSSENFVYLSHITGEGNSLRLPDETRTIFDEEPFAILVPNTQDTQRTFARARNAPPATPEQQRQLARNQPPLRGPSAFQQDPDNIISFQVDRDPEADDRLTLPTYSWPPSYHGTSYGTPSPEGMALPEGLPGRLEGPDLGLLEGGDHSSRRSTSRGSRNMERREVSHSPLSPGWISQQWNPTQSRLGSEQGSNPSSPWQTESHWGRSINLKPHSRSLLYRSMRDSLHEP